MGSKQDKTQHKQIKNYIFLRIKSFKNNSYCIASLVLAQGVALT